MFGGFLLDGGRWERGRRGDGVVSSVESGVTLGYTSPTKVSYTKRVSQLFVLVDDTRDTVPVVTPRAPVLRRQGQKGNDFHCRRIPTEKWTFHFSGPHHSVSKSETWMSHVPSFVSHRLLTSILS